MEHMKSMRGRKLYQVEVEPGAMFIIGNVTAVHRTMTHCNNPRLLRTIFRLICLLLHTHTPMSAINHTYDRTSAINNSTD